MKVLLIKTSSMGDVIHLLPALTDASKVIANIQFDWVVEENFAEIPSWHRQVNRVLPIALRHWRRHVMSPTTWRQWRRFINQLRAQRYDLVIDAQGLLKSALITRFSRGLRCGLSWHSAWEALASLFYEKKCKVNPAQHAITRMRELMAKALNYPLPFSVPEYGINHFPFHYTYRKDDYIVFIHGTTWQSKHWPEPYWRQLAVLFNRKGFIVLIPWNSQGEFRRAKRIAEKCKGVFVLPKLSLGKIASVLAKAKAVVAIDTGLGHLAAAFNIPCVSLYGPTNAKEVGTIGKNQVHISMPFACAPCRNQFCHYDKPSIVAPACFAAVTPQRVFDELTSISLLLSSA